MERIARVDRLLFIDGTYFRPMPDRPDTVADEDTVRRGGRRCRTGSQRYCRVRVRVPDWYNATLRTVHVWVGTAWTSLVLTHGFTCTAAAGA